MEGNVQRLLNRVSVAAAAFATISLLYVFSRSSFSCLPSSLSFATYSHPFYFRHPDALTLSRTPFPRSSCDASSRPLVPLEKRSFKLRSSPAWRRRVASFASLFQSIRSLGLLSNRSRALCVSAGAGHEVEALLNSGVADVTGVDIIDFPPLVSRSDPHNLPFFDGVFDLGFSTGLNGALFPARFVAEMERTVRKGGVCVVAVERCSSEEVEDVIGLFKRSSLFGIRNSTLVGSEMTLIIMRNNGFKA